MATTSPPKSTTDKTTSSVSVTMDNDEELQKVFKQFDSNGDGKISVSELGGVMKALGSSYTEEELKRVMEDVDSNRDGFIGFEEFSALCRSSSSSSEAAAELRDAFDLYDQDRNGLISAAELNKVLIRLGMGCSVEDCDRMIRPFDSDGDGNVNFEEFQKMMTSSSHLKTNGSAAADAAAAPGGDAAGSV